MKSEVSFQSYLGDFFLRNSNPMFVYGEESQSFLAVNKAAIELYGYSEAEFLGLKITDLLACSNNQSLKTNSTDFDPSFEKEISTEHRKKDGKTFWVKLSKYKTVFYGINAKLVTAIEEIQTNNTKAIAKENDLELETLSQVAKFTSNMVLITDEEGRINWVNNAVTETMKFSLTEILGKRPSEIFHGSLSSESVKQRIKTAIKNKEPFT